MLLLFLLCFTKDLILVSQACGVLLQCGVVLCSIGVPAVGLGHWSWGSSRGYSTVQLFLQH